MVHSLSDMFWDKRMHHLKLSLSCQREAGKLYSRHCYPDFLIPKLNEADLSFLLWPEQNTCRGMGTKRIISFWWWSVSGAAGQKRCLPLCSVSYFLQDLSFLSLTPVSNCFVNFYWQPSDFTLGTINNPHSHEVDHCSISDSAVQEWQDWAVLRARQSDEGRSSDNNHNQLQSSVIQAKPK